MATNDTTKTAAYENYPANQLTRGNSPSGGISMTAAQVYTVNLDIGTATRLDVEANLGPGAIANTDLILQVYPVDPQGNPIAVGIPGGQIPSVAGRIPTLVSGTVQTWQVYDVTSQDRVQVRFTNNAAPTKTLNYSCKVQ